MSDKIVEKVLKSHLQSLKISIITVAKKQYFILKGVFNPKISPSGHIVQKWISSSKAVFKGKVILDIGCGSGIPTCQIVNSGAKIIYATDINPKAIKNTKLNLLLYNLETKVIVNQNIDLIKPDIIFANLPAINRHPNNMLEKSFFDRDMNTTLNLFKELKKNVKWKKSILYLVYFDDNQLILTKHLKQLELNYISCIECRFQTIKMGIFRISNFYPNNNYY
jgi:tRNA G37 N-methylase Trm5